jgi:hypothetical protein
MPFEPITIKGIIAEDVGKPQNDGTPGSALYEVPFQLSHRAPPRWASLFVEAWNKPTTFTSSHRPGICAVAGDRVWLNGTTLDEVERTHKPTLKLAQDEANKKYAELVAAEEARNASQAQKDSAHEDYVREKAKQIKF